MKKTNLGAKILSLLLVLCMVAMLPCVALAAENEVIASGKGETYAWTRTSDGTLTISGTSMPDWNDGSSPWGYGIKNVVIEPGMTNIGNFAFTDCHDLISVTIPDSVTRIGKNAFMNCRKLTSINIPSGVTSIEEATFYRCVSLSSVTIPEGVTSIGSIAFKYCDFPSLTIPASVTSISPDALSGCMRMTEIVVAEDNPNYCSIDGIVYNKSVTEIVAVPSGMADGIVIPDSVTEIWEAAFAHNYNLTSITIPASVTKIGSCVFSDCPNIKKITFEGDAPAFGIEDPDFGTPFEGHLSYTEAYYPAGNPTWTEERMQACGKMLTWIPYEKNSEGGGETEPAPTEPTPTEPAPTEPTDNPKTGDMSLVLPSVLLLLTSAAGMICLTRKKHI